MKLPPFDSRVPFSKILIFVSFISFSVDSLNECSYGKSEKQLILKIDQHIVTSSKSFASLQSLKMFCYFICLIHENEKFSMESKSLLIKKDQPTEQKHYITTIIPIKMALVLGSCLDIYLS